MKENFKKIALRLVLLILIFLLSNYIYVNTFYEKDTEGYGNLLGKLNNGIQNADILYFSASPNQACAPTDKDTRSISKILDDELPSHSVMAVDTGAIHAGIYKKLIRMIPSQTSVQYVVVNMNYRSFGMGWIESDLENAIQKQSLFYNYNLPLWNRFLQGLNYYPTKTKKEREKTIQNAWKNEDLPYPFPRNSVNNWCEEYKWGDWQNPKRNLADHYIKNFAFVLDENNPRVKDFDEITEICREKNIPLIFLILAENMEQAEELVGENLVDLMIKNTDFLINRYESKGVIMVNQLNQVPDSCFYEREWPTEHYNFSGRYQIAKSTAEKINGKK